MKKLVAIMAAMSMLSYGTHVVCVNAEEDLPFNTYYLGDVNRDGKLDSSDASSILKDYALVSAGGTSNLIHELADLNGDGKVDSSDASCALSLYATLGINASLELKTVSIGTSDVIIQFESDNAMNVETGDIIQYNVKPVYLYTSKNGPIYEEKPFLTNGDRVKIVASLEDNWYVVFLPYHNLELYMQIDESNFKVIDNNETVTTIPEVTTTTTTETTAITEPIITTEMYNPMGVFINTGYGANISEGTVLLFTGESWNIYSFDENDIAYKYGSLKRGNKFVILDVYDEWYTIGFVNSNFKKMLIRIPEDELYVKFAKIGEFIDVQ